MRPVREIAAGEEDFRLERRGPFCVPRRDGVEPEPVGTIVLMAFRVTDYDKDCDGSLMARLEQIDRDGEETGWSPRRIGIGPDSDLVVTLAEWRAMFGGEKRGDGRPEPPDPSVPRLCRWPLGHGSTEWRYAVYDPGEDCHLVVSLYSTGARGGVPDRPGLEWLDGAGPPQAAIGPEDAR